LVERKGKASKKSFWQLQKGLTAKTENNVSLATAAVAATIIPAVLACC